MIEKSAGTKNFLRWGAACLASEHCSGHCAVPGDAQKDKAPVCAGALWLQAAKGRRTEEEGRGEARTPKAY